MLPPAIICYSPARGSNGESSAVGGNNPSVSRPGSNSSVSLSLGTSVPNRSTTDELDVLVALRMVIARHITINAPPTIQVTLPSAVADDRPVAPAPPPLPIPRPPPSERCNKTIAIKAKAKINRIMRITFSIVPTFSLQPGSSKSSCRLPQPLHRKLMSSLYQLSASSTSNCPDNARRIKLQLSPTPRTSETVNMPSHTNALVS